VPANLVAYTVTTTNKLRTVTATPFSGAARGWSIALPAQVSALLVILPWRRERVHADLHAHRGWPWLFDRGKQLAVWPQSISGVASLEQARVGSITGTPYGAGTAGVSLDTGGTAPVKDVNVSVMPRLAKGADRGGRACWMAVNVAGAPTMYVPYPCGRQSWRQIQ
jgi:type IV pilus assembly protein PilY1